MQAKSQGRCIAGHRPHKNFEKLQGSEFSGNNGIELSKDEKHIYVAHMKNMSKLTNTNPTTVVATAQLDYGVLTICIGRAISSLPQVRRR
ncbi:hypothetical protein [Moraxella ovis]|uniref:hypothetical protein n=1 Tax=Moraxella ovis TaxID=29433 RepID=UPI0011BEFB50|nr:hypothetical protein [Moraxella ovis]